MGVNITHVRVLSLREGQDLAHSVNSSVSVSVHSG